jgi:hypothetical protein
VAQRLAYRDPARPEPLGHAVLDDPLARPQPSADDVVAQSLPHQLCERDIGRSRFLGHLDPPSLHRRL